MLKTAAAGKVISDVLLPDRIPRNRAARLKRNLRHGLQIVDAASSRKGREHMFNSIKSWLARDDDRQADRRELETEAKQFKLPSEALPQAFKYLFFAGLAFLNYRLFAHAVPGSWGVATGVMAMMAEGLALYCAHNFSRSADYFRWALGISGVVLMAFSLVHGTFSILDLIGAADISETVREYSRLVAFPLLAGLFGLAVIAITMTHPKNIVRLKQALSHTRVAVGRAEAASELEIMRAQSAVEDAKLDRLKERSRREGEYLGEVQKLITIEERKRAMISHISDPALREALAREMGISPPQAPPTYSDGYQNGRSLD